MNYRILGLASWSSELVMSNKAFIRELQNSKPGRLELRIGDFLMKRL
jgi:hypothetical protein